jgi:hypothetical protein
LYRTFVVTEQPFLHNVIVPPTNQRAQHQHNVPLTVVVVVVVVVHQTMRAVGKQRGDQDAYACVPLID